MYYFIEPMVEADIGQVQQIERISFHTAWLSNTYRRELRSPSTNRYIVARASAVPPSPHREKEHDTSEVPARGGLFGMLLSGLFHANEANNIQNGYAPIVGYAGVWRSLDDAHITVIAVEPDQRGYGLGELLLNGLIDQALDMQASMLTLEVRISNVIAQGLYRKYGFYVAGTRPRYYTDNGEDALIMWTHSIRTPEYRARLGDLRRRLFARLRTQVEAPAAPHADYELGLRQSGTGL